MILTLCLWGIPLIFYVPVFLSYPMSPFPRVFLLIATTIELISGIYLYFLSGKPDSSQKQFRLLDLFLRTVFGLPLTVILGAQAPHGYGSLLRLGISTEILAISKGKRAAWFHVLLYGIGFPVYFWTGFAGDTIRGDFFTFYFQMIAIIGLGLHREGWMSYFLAKKRG